MSSARGARATAVLAAAGSGDRLGAGGPKALVALAGRPLVVRSLDALVAAECVGAIVVAAPPGHEAEVERIAGEGAQVVTGADSRSGSVARALGSVDDQLVVVHDAARPLAPAALFDALIAGLAADPDADGLIAAAPLADTVKRVAGESLEVAETIDRTGLWSIQTPQAFRTATLRRALDVPDALLHAATDDAMLVEAAGGRVRLHPNPDPNPKLTTAADLRVVEALLGER